MLGKTYVKVSQCVIFGGLSILCSYQSMKAIEINRHLMDESHKMSSTNQSLNLVYLFLVWLDILLVDLVEVFLSVTPSS